MDTFRLPFYILQHETHNNYLIQAVLLSSHHDSKANGRIRPASLRPAIPRWHRCLDIKLVLHVLPLPTYWRKHEEQVGALLLCVCPAHLRASLLVTFLAPASSTSEIDQSIHCGNHAHVQAQPLYKPPRLTLFFSPSPLRSFESEDYTHEDRQEEGWIVSEIHHPPVSGTPAPSVTA